MFGCVGPNLWHFPCPKIVQSGLHLSTQTITITVNDVLITWVNLIVKIVCELLEKESEALEHIDL